MSEFHGPTNNTRDVWDDVLREYRGYDQWGVLVEQRPYTSAENILVDAEVNRLTLSNQAALALTTNQADITTNTAFLAIVAPTNAQLAAQVQELTRQSTRQARQLSGLIRLGLNRLEAIS